MRGIVILLIIKSEVEMYAAHPLMLGSSRRRYLGHPLPWLRGVGPAVHGRPVEESTERTPGAPHRPQDEVDCAVRAVDEVLEREEHAGGAAHDEHGIRPRAPRDGQQEGQQRADGAEEAERGQPARQAEEEVRAVHVLGNALGQRVSRAQKVRRRAARRTWNFAASEPL